mgnify:FL=1
MTTAEYGPDYWQEVTAFAQTATTEVGETLMAAFGLANAEE